jgi:hypothetical protein
MLRHKRSIRIFALLCAVHGLVAVTASAQGFEIFGGYQFTHLEPAFNASGWNAALTKNFKHVLGITGDFSGAYKGEVKSHTYTVGPVFAARLPAVQPFAHALFGGITTSIQDPVNPDNTLSRSGFAMFLGAGMDVGFRNGIAVRVFQLDWLKTDIDDVRRDSNLRASIGLVFKF